MIEPTNPKEERTLAMACHLLALTVYVTAGLGAIVGPLILWLIKKDQYPLVDDQGKEAVNFNITMMIAAVVAVPLVFLGVGVCVLAVLGPLHIVLTIIAGLKANEGVAYRYPFNIRFIK